MTASATMSAGRSPPSTWRCATTRAWSDGARLKPVETATTVRVADGEALITDGPFADTKEVFGGFYLLEADDLDGALEIAARIPAARLGGSVEVRPIVEP